jgi:hypothetical protein
MMECFPRCHAAGILLIVSWFSRKWNLCHLIKVVLIFNIFPNRYMNVRSVADKVKATLRIARKKRGLGLDFVPHYA